MQRPIHLIFVSALLAFLPFMYAVSLAETAEIRKPVWAGKFYPETRLELMELIETLSAQAAGSAIAEPAGRKLNFLLQEFNREFNTMGAKAGKTEISHTIVNVKSELEKIREQVQNVE